jgi:ectoine hydroxylase-related dioxygenase (phytanoyl-CoA dioxygenase family)
VTFVSTASGGGRKIFVSGTGSLGTVQVRVGTVQRRPKKTTITHSFILLVWCHRWSAVTLVETSFSLSIDLSSLGWGSLKSFCFKSSSLFLPTSLSLINRSTNQSINQSIIMMSFFVSFLSFWLLSFQQQFQLSFAFVPLDNKISTTIRTRTRTRKVSSSSSSSSSKLYENPASSLLYKEQEKLLISQGEKEAEWMKDTWTPIEANVIRGAGGGGGFGAKKSGGSASSVLKAQAKMHAQELRNEGVVRIDNILSPAMADSIRERICEMKETNIKLVEDGTVPSIDLFANVLLKNNRWDMTIPIGEEEEWVAEALHSILMASPVGGTMANLLTPKSVLYELSCLISDPGSERQVIHPDTPVFKDGDPVLYTCFIALQDISVDMGPTTWIPKTHTAAMHNTFKDESSPTSSSDMTGKEQLLRTQPSVLGLLPKGCCAIFDSRLLHGGGANTSETSRALLYCSFKNPTVVNAGNPGSIRKNLIDRWTLDKMQAELKRFQKGKSCKLVSETTTTTTTTTTSTNRKQT